LPVRQIVNSLQTAGIPATISNSAGTFLCNHVLYGLLDYLNQTGSQTIGGFIHVPYASAQVADRPRLPSLPMEIITEALRIAIETALGRDARAA